MPAAPNTENQIIEKRLGPTSTPMTNCLMVRPLEMRAMKAPTYGPQAIQVAQKKMVQLPSQDRKSTRLNSSHANISYAVFCLKKKKLKHISIVISKDNTTHRHLDN